MNIISQPNHFLQSINIKNGHEKENKIYREMCMGKRFKNQSMTLPQ